MRARLVGVALAATSMVAISFLVPLGILVRDLAADRELSAAERDAEALARLLAVVGLDAVDELVGPVITETGQFGDRDATIVSSDGSVTGDELDEGEDVAAASQGATFRQQVSGGEAIYVPVVGAEGETAVVRVVARAEAMRSGVARVWVTLGLLGAVLVAVAVAVADRLGRSMIRPVDQLAAAADALGAGHLETRVDIDEPAELKKVGDAFNRLVSRVSGLLQQEREMAADMSHRLRTPLTAARLNVDAIPDEGHRDRISRQIDEIERVVDHIIQETRRSDRQAYGVKSDVRAVVANRIAFWEVLAVDERRQIEKQIDVESVLAEIPEDDLVAALDALIGNVFAHTEAGVGLRITVSTPEAGFVDVAVEDAGAGLPEDPRLFERGESGKGSTGLGLDIARRTARSTGGDLTIGRSGIGGAKLVMHLRAGSDV